MALFNLSEFLTIGILNKSKNPVFRIKSISNGQEYVLKKLQRRNFEAHLSDFAELTYILRCCHHPNIVKILGFSMNYTNQEYNLCLLMEMHKTDLQRLIDANRKTKQQFPKKQLMKIIHQLIDCLYFIQTHAKIAHRDLKPANILLDNEDNALITDFSEAYFLDSIKNNEYREDGIKGTPEYMSPELKKLFMGTEEETVKYNPWVSDVYSLGVTLINLATSFTEDTSQSLEEKLEIVEEVYGKLCRKFLERLVQEDQEKRGDFKNLMECKEYLNILEEVNMKESPVIPKEFDENFDRISIVLEDDLIESEEEKSDKDLFGRRVEIKPIKKFYNSADKIKDSEENKKNIDIFEKSKNINMHDPSIHLHINSPTLRKYQGKLSMEMKELKTLLKNRKKEEKIDGAICEMFKKIVVNLKELELENRVLKNEMKSLLIKKSSSMNYIEIPNNSNNNPMLRSHNYSVNNMNDLGDSAIPLKKSMNIIYNIDSNKKLI